MLKQFEVLKEGALSVIALLQKKELSHGLPELEEQKKIMLFAGIGFGVLMILFFMSSMTLLGIIFLGLAGAAGFCFSKLHALIASKEKEVK
jgi:hypothetical protein